MVVLNAGGSGSGFLWFIWCMLTSVLTLQLLMISLWAREFLSLWFFYTIVKNLQSLSALEFCGFTGVLKVLPNDLFMPKLL